MQMYYFLDGMDRMLDRYHLILQDARLAKYALIVVVLAAVTVTSVGIPIVFSW